MRSLFAILAVTIAVSTGCGAEKKPMTAELTATAQVGAMAALPNGGIRYGERLTGAIYDIDSAGVRNATPVAKIDVSPGGDRGLLGLVVDGSGRTFAAYTDPNRVLTIAQVTPGPLRLVWQGPVAPQTGIGGRLALTPQGRLLLAVGDLENRAKLADPTAPNGKLLTLDPQRGTGQVPNAISIGWNNPLGIAYTNGGELWVADNGFAGSDDRLARAGQDGTTGNVRSLGKQQEPWALTPFGDQELAVCFRASRKLQRFFVKDGVQTVPGRVVANDCSYGAIELSDGRLAYATENSIRVTVQ